MLDLTILCIEGVCTPNRQYCKNLLHILLVPKYNIDRLGQLVLVRRSQPTGPNLLDSESLDLYSKIVSLIQANSNWPGARLLSG